MFLLLLFLFNLFRRRVFRRHHGKAQINAPIGLPPLFRIFIVRIIRNGTRLCIAGAGKNNNNTTPQKKTIK